MRAAYYVGDRTFAVEEVEPATPGPGQVQLEVAYCGICGTDLHAYHGVMDGRIGLHRVIGHEMSGKVAALGEGVTGFEVGEAVVVRPLDHCGHCPACKAGHTHICHNLKFIGLDADGAFQDRWVVPAHTLHKIPADMSLANAAFVEPVSVAVHDVRRGRVTAGEDVLVIGAGPIGMLIALVARNEGARVAITEVSPARLEIARGLGFEAWNGAETDVGAAMHEWTGDKGADAVFEVSGSQAGATVMTAAASTRGRIVMVAIHPEPRTVDVFRFFWREVEMIGARVYEAADYDRAIALVASGDIPCDRLTTGVRPLEDIGAAFAELDGNAAAMKTLIRIGA